MRAPAYSSTLLNTASRHCPRAMHYQETGEPYDRRPFEVGIAAHAILEAVGNAANDDGAELDFERAAGVSLVCAESLIAFGREYQRKPEPPLSPGAVFAGRDLALDWLTREPMPPGARCEVVVAVDRNWRPVGYYDERAWLRGILDVVRVGERGDEESSAAFVTVRDYKSAWSAGEAELLTLQRKIQACLAWATWGQEAQAIRLEVVNLRTLRVHAAEYWPADGDVTLAEWRREIETTLRAYDSMRSAPGGLPAIVGGGCYGCPWALRCEEFRAFVGQGGIPESSEERAKLFVAAEALREALRPSLKADSDMAPIPVPGGVVGTVGRETRALTDDAYSTLWREWSQRGGDALGFARALGLTTGNAEALAKVLYPTRKEIDARRDLLAEVLTTKIDRRFGFHADQPQEEGE